MIHGSIFITGGTGSLGQAIVGRAERENWDATITVFSRDEVKQQRMKREHPYCRYVIGDVCDYDGLEKAMVGHSTVLHLAAFKHIPAGEKNARAVCMTNIQGSGHIAMAAVRLGVRQVLGISTDKACQPINVYGASKMLMERTFQEYDALNLAQFHLCRYGNVLSSTGSVIPLWKGQYERGEALSVTDPEMTRFWLTVEQAVDVALLALKEPHGTVTIPMLPSMALGDFAHALYPDAELAYIGTRYGEKKHEDLLSSVEGERTVKVKTMAGAYFRLLPPDQESHEIAQDRYTSENAPRLTAEELRRMLAWNPS